MFRKDSLVVLTVISVILLASVVGVLAFPQPVSNDVKDVDGLNYLNSVSSKAANSGSLALIGGPLITPFCKANTPSGSCSPFNDRVCVQRQYKACTYQCGADGKWKSWGQECASRLCDMNNRFCQKYIPLTVNP